MAGKPNIRSIRFSDELAERCTACGAPPEGRKRGQTYCSRFCYLLAMDESKRQIARDE